MWLECMCVRVASMCACAIGFNMCVCACALWSSCDHLHTVGINGVQIQVMFMSSRCNHLQLGTPSKAFNVMQEVEMTRDLSMSGTWFLVNALRASIVFKSNLAVDRV